MLKLFIQHGWIEVRRRGSHVIIEKNGAIESIPVHGNKDLKRGLEMKLRKRLKERVK